MESQPEDTSQPSVRESNNVTESNTKIEMSKDIPDKVEIEETSEDNSKRKRTSEAWNHFKRVKVEGIQFAECNYCKARLKAPAGYGTTHLHKHYENVCKKRPRKIDIRQSFVTTNKKPCFNMISRNTLKGDILKIYKDERTEYYNLLGKIKCRIAITTDMWTSSNNKGFMAVTGHFIDDNWTLHNCILRFFYDPTPHTAVVLVDTLVEALMDWNIDRKVPTITVDNCTTNDSMINHLLQKLPTKDMPLDGKVLHMRCCAHILNLIVNDGLYIIGSSIERICDSVIYWTGSPSRVEKFEETARQVPVNCTKKLRLDCKTRWNSTYLMLETAIIYKDVLPHLNVQEKNYKSLPTEEDWVNAIEICGKLKLFHQVRHNCYDLLFDYQSKCCTLNESSSSIGSLENTMSSDVHSNVNVDDSLDEFNNLWFQKLLKMARDILVIPVSTVASESAFSSSGKLINPYRNRLHHTTVEILVRQVMVYKLVLQYSMKKMTKTIVIASKEA
ncbi:UNVERIFIED_CONTAM: putative AC transposase [Sesamum angustifolium]|uniref:AC transposase n=1 Tax=Sesamum angustifolium TaxID=2727405 RepID=A0AAW2LGT6_9LAMI